MGRGVIFLAVTICFAFLVNQASSSREEAQLEWSFLFSCDSIGLTSYFTHVKGLQNRNEWECERFTAPNGRETTSCLPSQLVVQPLQLQRVLTTNDVSSR
jgi:hypothetical protein